MAITPQWKDELRARITLSSLIGRTTRIQKAGREYKACCPFHNEKTPSFTINDEKGFYHCFGCGAHGDAISWMIDNRGLSFMDAIKELAGEAGMEVPAPDPRAKEREEKRSSLFDVMQAAQDWFVAQLRSIKGAPARDYLKDRGLNNETLARFGFGFAPDGRGNIAQALCGFPTEQLIEAGLLIAVDGKQPYDRFRGRIMIPIYDARGRVIAFGGRILGDGEPKYLNSPDTPLFDKGRTLYNIHNASPAARQSGRLILVEGYMDAIALAQAGFDDVVAPLGTALTEEQIGMAWKMVETPILCFDGDSAGQKAAMRVVNRALPMLRAGHSLHFATLPAGMDPDDLIQKNGPDAFAALLNSAHPMIEKLWVHERESAPIETPEQQAGLKSRLSAWAKTIQDHDIARFYEQSLMDRFYTHLRQEKQRSIPYQAGRGPLPYRGKTGRISGEARHISSGGEMNMLLKGVLAALLLHPQYITEHEEALLELKSSDNSLATLLDALLVENNNHQHLDSQTLLPILRSRGLGDNIGALMRADSSHYSFTKTGELTAQEIRDLGEAITLLVTRPRIVNALKQATQRFEAELDDKFFDEQQKLLLRKQEFDRRMAVLIDQARA